MAQACGLLSCLGPAAASPMARIQSERLGFVNAQYTCSMSCSRRVTLCGTSLVTSWSHCVAHQEPKSYQQAEPKQLHSKEGADPPSNTPQQHTPACSQPYQPTPQVNKLSRTKVDLGPAGSTCHRAAAAA
jgi:hypothetical protein